ALKIIKVGMDTREVVARFEAERQAVAMMDHPNIAKVFDAGATESPHNVAQASPPASSPGVSPGVGPGGGTPPKPAGADASSTRCAAARRRATPRKYSKPGWTKGAARFARRNRRALPRA